MIISGILLSIDQKIIPNANVFEVGKANSTKTNADGKFSIDIKEENLKTAQLKFTHIGYDYDTVAAMHFLDKEIFELYPNKESLSEISVSNNYKYCNWWIYLLIGGAIGYFVKSKVPTTATKKAKI
jgi:hypothetical protein